MKNQFRAYLTLYRPELLGVCLCLLINVVSGLASSQSDFGWYSGLNKPFFNPPSYVFAPVWTVLYILIGWTLGRVYKSRNEHPELLYWFILQLFFNAIWSFIFFTFHNIFLAMLDLIALWIALTALMVQFKMRDRVLLFSSKNRDNLSFILLLPYWAWTSFAMILNISLFYLNR